MHTQKQIYVLTWWENAIIIEQTHKLKYFIVFFIIKLKERERERERERSKCPKKFQHDI